MIKYILFKIHDLCLFLSPRKLMNSSDIDVSFRSVRIIAQLLCSGIKPWSITSIFFNKISDELVSFQLLLKNENYSFSSIFYRSICKH